MEDQSRILLDRLEERLTEKNFIRKFGIQKKEMQKLLHKSSVKNGLKTLLPKVPFTCKEVLEICREPMARFSPEPEQGWLQFLFEDGKHVLYPDNFPDVMEPCYELGKVFYLETLRIVLEEERDLHGADMFLHFALASEEEQEGSSTRDEYRKFLEFCRNTYFLEFMRIAAEVTPFNTHGHIAGVHNVSMYMARQLAACGQPVDLALMSGAAIGHDIGKFGCKEKEARRVPYLHYYYTDQLFKRFDMPTIGYIGANHSAWDLELENLSLESLLLIYADFRVKSTRKDGVEIIHCYTLKESFDVILGKLDNVDAAKEKRYRKVYGKLKDFEDYMVRLGVHTDFSSEIPDAVSVKDSALVEGPEVVTVYKDMAISHNTRLMNILNHESTFTNILEAARSEKDWKNTRTYLNIFREYNTYLNQRQKLLTISFLYELLMHRESDIRSEAATLMGEIIVNFDTEYRKEIPEGMMEFVQLSTSLEQFERYVDMILIPDHKLTEQHRMWLGYKLETLCISVLKNCKENRRKEYLEIIHRQFLRDYSDSFTVFVLLEAIERMPIDDIWPEMLDDILRFALRWVPQADHNLQVMLILLALRLRRHFPESDSVDSFCRQILEEVPNTPSVSILYIKQELGRRLRLTEEEMEPFRFSKDVDGVINELFLENLKTGTPWIAKMVNIHYLYDRMVDRKNNQPVHTTTHLVNLLSGTECGDVRHLAGRALVEMAGMVSNEQRNEIAIELLKALDLGEAEFSKNIPQYLGQIIAKLRPEEVDEIILNLEEMLISAPDSTACVVLDTIGHMMQWFGKYRTVFPDDVRYIERSRKLVGLLLRGIAHYHTTVSQEARYVFGEYIFGQGILALREKYQIFRYMGRKAQHILMNSLEDGLGFLIDAATLNSIYRFLSEYILENGEPEFEERDKVAFFPGSFDPFSLSHKGIVEAIRKLGFTVYLAIDEFSWSKHTQPPLVRRKIAGMSTAEYTEVYLFPQDKPVNIANNEDMESLAAMFPGKTLYLVAGTDVTKHASAYKAEPAPWSVHSFNHILFSRHGEEYEVESAGVSEEATGILGDVIELSLPLQLEDISSTRIRENIDLNRDISHLIDPMAQNYIYENNLYLREPQYKGVMFTRKIRCDVLDGDDINDALWQELETTVLRNKKDVEAIRRNLTEEQLSLAVLRDGDRGGRPVALAMAGRLYSTDLLQEFGDLNMVRKIRNVAWGKIMVIKGVYGFRSDNSSEYVHVVLAELLAHCLARDYTYCLYHGVASMQERRKEVEDALAHKGFVRLSEEGAAETILGVDMHRPITLTNNIESVIKTPFNTNPRVQEVIERTHRKLQLALTRINPGNLVISFHSSIMYHKLLEKITEINQVPNEATVPRQLGRKMCVPFGKILRDSIAPNTVTKALHTEKVFNANMHGFSIEEYPNYTSLETQILTIRSFHRPLILVDDLLHKGYRIRKLSALLSKPGIEIDRVLVGVMTAGGQDLLSEFGIGGDYVYYIPNISSWFVESSLYPFIGGDSVRTQGKGTAGLLTSVNLIMPYVTPAFLAHENIQAVYQLSMVCLENARDILKVLEEEYQKEFERNLTLDRLSEVIYSPTCPDKGRFMSYDENIPASNYIENDILQLSRLEYMTSMQLKHTDFTELHSD